MAALRDRLIQIRDEAEKFRESYRRNGLPGHGPIKMRYRREILSEVLRLQDQLGEQLIRAEEVELIQQIWVSDGLAEHMS